GRTSARSTDGTTKARRETKITKNTCTKEIFVVFELLRVFAVPASLAGSAFSAPFPSSEVQLRADGQDTWLQRLRCVAERGSVVGRDGQQRMRVQRVEQVALNLPVAAPGRQLELLRETQVQLVPSREVQAA